MHSSLAIIHTPTGPHVARNDQDSSLPISLICFIGVLALSIDHQSKTCDPYLLNDWHGIPHSLLHQIKFVNMWNPHGLLYSQGYNQSLFDSMPRHVAAVIANNDGYTTTHFVIIHSSQKAVILIVSSLYNKLSAK
ncbi:hypothetical protein TNCV_2858261 [Trichonephila clavipes]|nr:hypothetical protein TNCV_2858261 [Trichonephila clavipes]